MSIFRGYYNDDDDDDDDDDNNNGDNHDKDDMKIVSINFSHYLFSSSLPILVSLQKVIGDILEGNKQNDGIKNETVSYQIGAFAPIILLFTLWSQ